MGFLADTRRGSTLSILATLFTVALMQADIGANAHKLYERHEMVREMESFFIAAYEAWKTGDTLTGSSFLSHPDDPPLIYK